MKTTKTNFVDGRTPIKSQKTSVEATGKKIKPDLAKGGKGKDAHMLGPQKADPVKPGLSSGKGAAGKGPDKQFAEGGSAPGIPLGADPALPGRTGTPSTRGTQRTDYSK